jgi:glycosyltransferase involved in cell wall biosynthesis
MLGTQAAGRTRGVGRYTRQLVRHLLGPPDDDEYLLYFYEGLPGDDEAWPGKAAVRHVCVGPAGNLRLPSRRLARENPDRLDVLLLSCALENFQGYLPPDRPLRAMRMAAVVHDLIPSHYPQHYLRHPAIDRAYRRTLAALRHYDLLLAISETVRSDCCRILGMPANRVVNISAGSDPAAFFPDRSVPPPASSIDVLRAAGVSPPYIFALSALDERKNLAGLFAAYRLLPARLRESHRLVVTCSLSEPNDLSRAREMIGQSGIAERVVLTSAVDDATLRVLYQRSSAFVFPSLCEGFGLPLVEAMQCGAVVVAGDNSSQVEVVGEAGLLADASDPADIAGQLARALDDTSLAEELRRRAVVQARRFDWTASAAACHSALSRAVASPPASHWFRRLASRGALAVTQRAGSIQPLSHFFRHRSHHALP